MEGRLKDKYEGIFKENSKGDTIINDGEDEDNSSDDDEDAYGGFEGDDHVSESMDENILSQSINITGV